MHAPVIAQYVVATEGMKYGVVTLLTACRLVQQYSDNLCYAIICSNSVCPAVQFI